MKRIFIFLGLIISSVLNAQYALEFDGIDDYVNSGNDQSLQISSNEITLEAWIYTSEWKEETWMGTVISKEQMMMDGNTIDEGYMMRIGNNGSVNFTIGGHRQTSVWNELETDEGVLSLDTWHHIACVYDGTSMIIYVDGVKRVIMDRSIEIGNAPDMPLYIGNSPQWPDRGFEGQIDEVRVWNVARTSDQIITAMNTELPGFDREGLVLYLRFNEVSGQIINDETGNSDPYMGSNISEDDNDPVRVEGAPLILLNPTPVINKDSLIAYFNFEEITTNNTILSTIGINDTSIEGSINGNIVQDYGPKSFGMALKFDGTSHISFNDYSDIFDLSKYDKVTLACWAKFDDFNDDAHQNLLSRGDFSYTLKKGKNNGIEFLIFDGVSWHAIQTPPSSGTDADWMHLASTFDGNTLKLYVDGVEIISLNWSGSINQVTDVPFTIGNDASNIGTRNFSGVMDEAYVFGRALSADEINQLYSIPVFVEDTIPPYIISTNPANNSSDVMVNQDISIKFSERMNFTSIRNAISIFPEIDNINYVQNGREIIISHDNFSTLTKYTVTIDTNANDVSGLKLKENYDFSFTISKFSGSPLFEVSDDTICSLEDTVMITFTGSVNDSITYNWRFVDATIVSGDQTGPYELQFTSPGENSISLTFYENDDSISFFDTIWVSENITVDIEDVYNVCPGTIINLEPVISGGIEPYSYIWSFNDTVMVMDEFYDSTFSFTPFQSRSLLFTVKDGYRCSKDQLIKVNVAQTYQNQKICLVTVDQKSGKNLVVWEKIADNTIDYYNIYRESSIGGVYDVIGSVPHDNLSVFLDTSSNPEKHSDKYKILVVDTCGHESDLSSYHQTMHLSINTGLPGTYNLQWSPYIGFDYGTYYIYKGSSPENLILFDSVANSILSYTDTSSGPTYYQIAIVKDKSCIPAERKKAQAEPYNKVVSNIEDNLELIDNIYHFELDNVLKIYPNPTNDLLIIDYKVANNSVVQIKLLNIIGQIVYSTKEDYLPANKYSMQLNIQHMNLSKGIYYIKVIMDGKEYHKKALIK